MRYFSNWNELNDKLILGTNQEKTSLTEKTIIPNNNST